MTNLPPLEPVTVALVEDDAGTRARLVAALGRLDTLQLRFQAGTATDMIHWLEQETVNVLLVDLGLPDRSGLDVIRYCRSRHPATEVMVITLFGDEAHMTAAFEAGARGYLLKDGSEADLARHVVDLRAGGSPITPVIARQLLQRMAPAAPTAEPDDAGLTERERQTLQVLSRGYTYSEAAALLEISPGTVQTHVKNIYSKLAVRSKTEAVFEARQRGLLP